MSTCAGKTECEIYRDKKYCRKAIDKLNGYDGICYACRHATYLCKVGFCPFESFCGMKDQPSIEECRDLLGDIRV